MGTPSVYVNKTANAIEKSEQLAVVGDYKGAAFWLDIADHWQSLGMAIRQIPRYPEDPGA